MTINSLLWPVTVQNQRCQYASPAYSHSVIHTTKLVYLVVVGPHCFMHIGEACLGLLRALEIFLQWKNVTHVLFQLLLTRCHGGHHVMC